MVTCKVNFCLVLVCWLALSSVSAQTALPQAASVVAVDSSTASNEAPHPRAELLWIEQLQTEYQVRFSELIDGQWTPPKVLFASDNSLTSPALGSSSSGDRLAIWTEQRRAKTVLQSMHQTAGGRWGPARIFTDTGRENYAASIVFDLNDVAWVFWSSTRKALSEIFMAKSAETGWSKPQQIHPENSVPDILPVAALNTNGDVEVEWTQYSFAEAKYLRIGKTIAASQSGSVANSNNKRLSSDAVAIEDLALPKFLPHNALSALHFPTNMMIQSRPISKN